MSYDYSLFRSPGPGPMSSWKAVPPAPLGTLEDVRSRLSELYPEATWERSHGSYFGWSKRLPEDACEFQLTPDEDGLCRFITVRRITRDSLMGLCRALDVIAVDAQKVELIRP
jgi:hypothetical protein